MRPSGPKVALDAFYESLGEERLDRLEAVSMDMWKPYILLTAWHVPDAEKKIALDRFHVVKHLGDAVDKVRRQDNREVMKDGDERLKGTKTFGSRSREPWLGSSSRASVP